MRASLVGTDTIKLLCIYKKMATALYILHSERVDLEAIEKATANLRREGG